MNLKQARYIQTIAQEGSITAAARKLYISQPSLSQMLKQVEVELGAALFDRSVSPVHLTLAGEACLQAAEAILAANDRLERQLQEIRDESRGRLRLGISVQRGMQVLPLALPWFLARFPHVALEITERGSADLEELVLKGGVDVALAVIDSTSPRLRYELIEEEVTGILAGAGSRLAARFPSGTAPGWSRTPCSAVTVCSPKFCWRAIPSRWPGGWRWERAAVCCAPTCIWTIWRSGMGPFIL